jgi:spore coat polysaccharide biosynthesis protein SpsF (cytidylyltransferase family)
MEIGVFITARLGSSRLPRKHLLSVAGKPLMVYLLERIATEFAAEIKDNQVSVVIVTSDEPENRDFKLIVDDYTQVFYGSIDNIPLRHHQAASALSVDAIIAVDGDDILCSTQAMRSVYQALRGGCPYVRSKGLPFGMNVSGYTTSFLETSLEGHRKGVLETGWTQIFADASVTELDLSSFKTDNRLRFTLDYPEDYQFFTALIEALGEKLVTANHDEIVEVVEQKLIYRLNQNIAQEYWANFHQCMERERNENCGRKQGISA